MLGINPKLKYLQSQLADLEKKQEKIEKKIDEVLPADILTKDALEKQLYSIFDDIEDVQQKIQTEENIWNDKIAQQKFDALIPIIQSNQIVWKQVQQAYQNTLPHWPVKVQQNLDDARSIINELNKIPQGSLTYSALDEFIANLFNEISDFGVKNTLAQWRQQYCENRDWLGLHEQIQKSEARRLETSRPAILIAIARHDETSTQSPDGETYYQLESWLIEDIEIYQSKKTGFHSLLGANSPDSVPCLLEELLGKITSLLARFLQKQREYCRNSENYPEIHVFLPLELMHLAVDVWPLENSPRLKYLGHDYLVFIRCANRYDGNYNKAPTWKKLWKRHQNSLQENAQNVFVLGHDKYLDKLVEILYEAVKDDSKAVGLHVTKAPISYDNFFYELLESGLPLAIWPRCNLARSKHRTEVSKLLASSRLETLPSRVKDKRCETRQSTNTAAKHIGHHLSLLWDDPNFRPPRSA